MEGIIVAAGVICATLAVLSVAFLMCIQPIWGTIDIAISDKLSKGAKITLLLLLFIGIPVFAFSVIGIVFIPVILFIPFFYGLFFTHSNVLKKFTRGSTLMLILSVVGLGLTATQSSTVKENMEQYKNFSFKKDANQMSLEVGE